MPPTDSPTWWADVQQDREDLGDRGRRPAEDWLGEEIDFVPRRRITGRRAAAAPVALDGAEHELHGAFIPTAPHAPVRTASAPPPARVIELGTVADAAPARHIELVTPGVAPAASRVIELVTPDDTLGSHAIELRRAATLPSGVAGDRRPVRADDPFATPPPPPGARRTVHIKGRPHEHRLPSMALRHRPRTTSERVGPRPDRIAMWAVILGLLLIVLAALTS